MQRKSFGSMPCPIARSLERVGEWWSILILRDAFHGLTRFDQFQKSLDIAPNMLTRRLQCAGRIRAAGAPALQRAAAAGRISADRAGPRLPAGAVVAARLGQQALRARGRASWSSTARPASRPTRSWWTGATGRSCWSRRSARCPARPRRATRRHERGRPVERDIDRPARRSGVPSHRRAGSWGSPARRCWSASVPHGTAMTGGRSGASSRAPTMPMSAATSR